MLICVGVAASLSATAGAIKSELESAAKLVPQVKADLTGNKTTSVAIGVSELRAHTSAARSRANDPLWTLASAVPGLGANFRAITEVARSADDVATLGVAPLADAVQSLQWENLLPTKEGTDLAAIRSAMPRIKAAAHAVRTSASRLASIDESALLPEVAAPLAQARSELQAITGVLDAAADAAEVAPAMLGADQPRKFLLMVQNNAESRASGGIPGALAVLNVDKGKLTLEAHRSASDVSLRTSSLSLPSEQQDIYTRRLGRYMQDVNLTPDFPTAASSARAMWERATGQSVDGVLSLDPVALAYVLKATGPVELNDPALLALSTAGLPIRLDGENVVRTLLSDVYAKIADPRLQDAYFAGVAQETFAALSNGSGNPKGLIDGLSRGTTEGRILAWSANRDEQSILQKYAISGSVSGPSVAPAQFGVYFNDGTGAKMDYYVRRTVQLMKMCPVDGYERVTVRITSTNNAPLDAATSLPSYVTGGGMFGVAPGSVQTNIVAYGPVQAHIETAELDGQRTEFAPYFHAKRPVGVYALRLAPGETKTIEFTFGKIAQHTEPVVVVTPTVEPVEDVTLPTTIAACS